MKKKVIYGPPGTGKTTYLMQLLAEELARTPAEQIAFVSYTRQGTYEGVQRAIKKFKLTAKQTRYFKTIHSLCFTAVGAKKNLMVSKSHYKLLSEKTGLSFTGYYSQDFTSTNDAYIHAISMRKHNPKYAETLTKILKSRTLKYVDLQYNAMKSQLGLMDFDDLLLKYLGEGQPLDAKVAFIDEGQDLTPLQWKVIKKLFSKCESIYVAGDDDQAVYEWAGANVKEFISFSNDTHVLDQSYRIPAKVMPIAKRISDDIKIKFPKRFRPQENQGEVETVGSLSGVKFKGGELVLARTNWILQSLATEIAFRGLPFEIKGVPYVNKMELKAIKAHIAFQKGELDYNQFKVFRAYFKEINKNKEWRDVIDMSDARKLFYVNMLIQNSEKFKPIKFETFHSCKGTENDHVVVSADMSQKVYKHMFHNYDSELRCLYVAMTRTKQKLTLLLPKKGYFYPQRYFRSENV